MESVAEALQDASWDEERGLLSSTFETSAKSEQGGRTGPTSTSTIGTTVTDS